MNSSGFDPSLFHDDDGRKWFVNQQWKHTTDSVGGRPRGTAFDGILAQEYDPVARRLTGPITQHLRRLPPRARRGPAPLQARRLVLPDHRRRRHRLRPRRDHGPLPQPPRPLRAAPETHLITSKDAPDAALQRAGHGQIVETPDGAVYHTHLCSRPLPGTRDEPARPRDRDPEVRLEGRRLALPRTRRPGARPRGPRPGRRARARARAACRLPLRRPGAAAGLPVAAHALPRAPLHPDRRRAAPARPRVVGSWFDQALVARRQQHHAYRAETRLLAFDPDTYQQNAGLTTYYNRHKFHFLAVTHRPASAAS